jgi:hypothetical protein
VRSFNPARSQACRSRNRLLQNLLQTTCALVISLSL